MAYEGFITLQCRIEAIAESRCRATTQGGLRGPQSVDFELPLTLQERGAWLAQFREPFSPEQPDRWRTLQEFGSALFDAIFQGENLATWRILSGQARQDRLLLRLVLDIPDEALQALPWEALYDSTARFFLARDPNTCLIRFPRDPDQPPLFEPRAPLRLLAFVAAPQGMPALDVAGERQRLEAALAPLVTEGSLVLTWLDRQGGGATLRHLTEILLRAAEAGAPYDVLHYIGHAGWSEQQREGVLLLEDEAGRQAPTRAIALGDLLRRGQLRLAVLNACEGSRVEEAAPFRSVAATLMGGADLPAIIANQIDVSDRAAKAFAGAFYGALAQHRTVEEAVIVAREEVAEANDRNPEWVATVFFSRFIERPIRLLPVPAPAGINPLLTSVLLFFVTILMGVTVVSFFRVLGLVVGGAFQLGVWALAAWIAYDRWDRIFFYRRYILSALGLATLVVLAWFTLYQPTLRAPAPPADFALALEEPSPLIFQDAAIRRVSLSVDVRGKAFQVPVEHFVWILVQAENSATYVAGAEATLEADGRFTAADVVVGPPILRPVGDQRYTLQPVLVDTAGHRFLQAHTAPFWRFFHPDIRVEPQPRLQSALVIRQ